MGASSFWPAFAKTLPMMLGFGIVGPVFTVVYFLVDSPEAEWLLWWGVTITALDVALAALVARSQSRRDRSPLDLQIAAAQAFTSVTAEPGKPADQVPVASKSERLAELDELMKKDLLTTEEYQASRKRILGEI